VIKEQGVDHAIDYRSQDFEAEVRRITGGDGVDVVFDALGPTSFRKDYRLLREGGRLIMYGASEVQSGERRKLTKALRTVAKSPLLLGAVVEGPGRDEREQGGLRAQHAQVVGS
jgi:NADPH:quinone reductase-like Zn-dependent oxidoreductase